MADRAQIVVELVDQRDAGRDVQIDHVLLRHLVQVLNERSQAVAVGGDENSLASANRRRDGFVPVG